VQKANELGGITLHDAVIKAIRESNLEEGCNVAIIPLQSPRATVYMDIEVETLRQQSLYEETLAETIAEADPRDAMDTILEQLRNAAMAIHDPHQFTVELMRTLVTLTAAYEWSLKNQQAFHPPTGMEPPSNPNER
jgi:hypothetical protein